MRKCPISDEDVAVAIEPDRVKALFQAAIERRESAERRAFLDAEIGDDAPTSSA